MRGICATVVEIELDKPVSLKYIWEILVSRVLATKGFVVKYVWEKTGVNKTSRLLFSRISQTLIYACVLWSYKRFVKMCSFLDIFTNKTLFSMKYLLDTSVSWYTFRGNLKEIAGLLLGDIDFYYIGGQQNCVWSYLGYANFHTCFKIHIKF